MVSKTKITADRRDQADEIRDAAVTRAPLGQHAMHRRLPDGRHEISLFDRDAGELRTYSGNNLVRRA